MAEVAPVVPMDMWICSECRGGNLIEIADEYCPVCGHPRCGLCLGPGQAYNAASALEFSTDALSLATSSSAVPSTSPSFSRISACSSQEHDTNHIGDFNNAGITTNMEGDVWICSECGGANFAGNSPDRCPVCGHYRCDQCT